MTAATTRKTSLENINIRDFATLFAFNNIREVHQNYARVRAA